MVHRVIALLVGLLASSPLVYGMAEEKIGPDPEAHAQPGWADGLVVPLRHESRVYSLWVNGNNSFYYNANPSQLAEVLQAYSEIRLRDHVIRVKSGQPKAKSFEGEEYAYNIHLTLLEGIALWHQRRTIDEAVTHEPVLTVYVNSDADRTLIREFEWPDHVVLRNDTGIKLTGGKKAVPDRRFVHAAAMFEDGSPACDFEAGMRTTVMLWEKDHPHGFNLGEIDVRGNFKTAFSDQEISNINNETMWLTITVGNYLNRPRPTDRRIKMDVFAESPEAVRAISVARSTVYFGRILFDDGTPPTLNPAPWPGAEIQVSFPIAGMVRPDKEGYFRITLTADQLAKLKARKDRKNIYVPEVGERNHSRAMHVFPVANLATDKSRVEAVKIVRPDTPADSPDGEE